MPKKGELIKSAISSLPKALKVVDNKISSHKNNLTRRPAIPKKIDAKLEKGLYTNVSGSIPSKLKANSSPLKSEKDINKSSKNKLTDVNLGVNHKNLGDLYSGNSHSKIFEFNYNQMLRMQKGLQPVQGIVTNGSGKYMNNSKEAILKGLNEANLNNSLGEENKPSIKYEPFKTSSENLEKHKNEAAEEWNNFKESAKQWGKDIYDKDMFIVSDIVGGLFGAEIKPEDSNGTTRYMSSVGGLAEGAIGMVEGLVTAVCNPIDTLKALGQAVSHPAETVKNLCNSFGEGIYDYFNNQTRDERYRLLGKVAFEFIDPGKITKVNKLSGVSKLTDKMSDVNKVSDKVKIPDIGKIPDKAKIPDIDKIPDKDKAPDKAKTPDKDKAPDKAKISDKDKTPDEISDMSLNKKVELYNKMNENNSNNSNKGDVDFNPNALNNSNSGGVNITITDDIADATKVTKVKFGEHIKITKEGRKTVKELKPNVEYTTKYGYTYTTDAEGRINSVKGTLKLGKQKRDLKAQREVGGEDRLPNDNGGHLIAHQFGGEGGIDNLVAMDASVNKAPGEWRKLEIEWEKNIREGNDVYVEIYPIYDGNSKRPKAIEVRYKINNVEELPVLVENTPTPKK